MDESYRNRLRQYYIRNEADFSLDDITFNDLNLDDYFLKIDRTSSSLGQEVLYGLLRQPLIDQEEILNRKKRIDYYRNNTDETIKITKQLKNLPKLRKISVFDYLDSIEDLNSPGIIKLIIPIIMMIIPLILLFINSVLGIVFLVLVYSINSIRYFKLRSEIAPYFISLSYLSKAVYYGQKIKDPYFKYDSKLNFLKYAHFLLGTISGETVNNGSGSIFDVILDFFKLGFHIDIIRFYLLLNKIHLSKVEIFKYLKELGYIDALIAISMIPQSEVTTPVFVTSNKIIFEEAVHPLVKNAIPNSISTDRSILLTGSNASGKSTFLKMIALNAVLSQSIVMVYAKKYEGPITKVVSAMSVQDSILNGDSYYMAEIKGIKRIVDMAQNEKNILIISFVDEVLRGTNTRERIAASTYILKYLSEKSMCFASTHDKELTDYLKEEFDNYHFNEKMIDDDIVFDYKIKAGPANSHNAVLLLKQLGFPEDIIYNAEKMALLS